MENTVEQAGLQNLIQPGTFYYHPNLQISSPAPKFLISDDGSIMKDHVRFRLRLKKEFLLDSLVYYFRQKFKSEYSDIEEDRKGIQYLLKRCDHVRHPMNKLDLAMFTIDVAGYHREADGDFEGFVMPQQIAYLIPEALRRYHEKVALCKEYGLDKET